MNNFTSFRTAVLYDLLLQIKCAAQLMIEQPEQVFFYEKMKSLITEYDATFGLDIFQLHTKYSFLLSSQEREIV